MDEQSWEMEEISEVIDKNYSSLVEFVRQSGNADVQFKTDYIDLMINLTCFASVQILSQLIDEGVLNIIMTTFTKDALWALTNFCFKCPELTDQIFINYSYLEKIWSQAVEYENLELPLCTMDILLRQLKSLDFSKIAEFFRSLQSRCY